MSSSNTKPAFVTNEIEPRIQRRNDKRRTYHLKRQQRHLKRQQRGRSGNVAGPSTTRGRKRDRASPPYSILNTVLASFSDEDWKAISSFSTMSDDVFLSAISEITKKRRNDFHIGIVTSDSRSGSLRCDVLSPRNLLIPLWYKEERVILAIVYDLKQDSGSGVYSCARVEYLDPSPRDNTSLRNLHRDLMARVTEELLVVRRRRSSRMNTFDQSVQSMVRSKYVHISAVCGKSRVEYDGNEKRRLAGFPRMGLSRRKLTELQNQKHLLGGLCHRFGFWWEYFNKSTKHVDPLDLSRCSTLLNVVDGVASWWKNARTRSDVVVESYDLLDIHDHIMSMVCRTIGMVKFDILGDDDDGDSDDDECHVTLEFSRHVGSTVTITTVRILPTSTREPCDRVDLFLTKDVS